MNRAIVLFVLVALTESAKLPANFKKCNRNQPDWKECALQAAQNGVAQLTRPFKQIHLPSLNPLEVPELNLGIGTGSVVIDQSYKNCKVYGFDKVKLDQFEFDFDKKILKVAGLFPEINVNCQYKVDGKVLLLAVKGEGDSFLNLKNTKSTSLLTYEERVKNGKTYFKFVSDVVDIEPGFASFHLDNLFNGDKELGDNINKVLNENWKELFQDVKKEYSEAIGQIALGLINNFFSKVSVEEAFD